MEEPTVRAQCPNCRHQAAVPEQALGRKARCPQCKTSFVLAALPPEDGPTAPLTFAEPPSPPPQVAEDLYPETESLPDPVSVAVPLTGAAPLTADGRKALITGTVIAVVVFALPFSRFIFSYLGILTHELGHTAAAWLFGYPSLPALDFRYGGGWTVHAQRSTAVLTVLYAGFAFLLWRLRDHPRALGLTAALVVTYSFAAFTSLHELFIVAMGHGLELIVAGIFLFRAIAGREIQVAIERPLYAACSVFMILGNVSLAWGLMSDAEARQLYRMSKGGACPGDLSRIAREFLAVGEPSVAFLLLLGCLATPCLSYLAYRHGALLARRLEF